MLPHVRIASALKEAKKAAHDHVIRTRDISRETREILSHTKWLREIIKGYYLLTNPSAQDHETTVWQGVYWNFLALYLDDRFGKNYVLSPENSLDIQTRNTTLPVQIMLQSTTGGQGITQFPHGCSLFNYCVSKPSMPSFVETHEGIRIFPLELALVKTGPAFFEKNRENAHIALRLADVQKLSRHILEGDASVVAVERIYQGLLQVKRTAEAERLRMTLKAVGIILSKKKNVIESTLKIPRSISPYAERIKLLWHDMREMVVKALPKSPGIHGGKAKILKSIEATYTHDAYHSLSIEGYKVSEELIEKVRAGAWDLSSSDDHDQLDAMAAKGYFEAFHAVKESIETVLDGGNVATVFENDLSIWFTALFSPSVQAGLLKASDLAGYRNKPVFIRGSHHVPPPSAALMDCMEALFECLNNEPHAGVQAILGHFIFTFIHPFPDGNGRIGRFLMNMMLVSGGYPWTIIRSDREHRTNYLEALEEASVQRKIARFCQFVAKEMTVDWK